MIYLELFLGFLKVGCFAFGGAYGAIALIREVVLSHGWVTEEVLANMIAVSESTPGPIMVNLATYVGSSQAGFFGALAATLAVILPSFVIILLIVAVLKNFLKNPYVQSVIRGMKPCVAGIVLATGLQLSARCILPAGAVDFRAVVIGVLLLGAGPLFLKLFRRKLSPISLIALSALLGMAVYSL